MDAGLVPLKTAPQESVSFRNQGIGQYVFGKAPSPFRLPRPTSTAFVKGRMYFCQLPMPLDQAILPHAVVTDQLLVLSFSPAQTERIVAGGSQVTDPVIAMDEKAGAVSRLRTEALLSTARAWLEFALVLPNGPLAGAPPDRQEDILKQVDVALQVLGTFRGLASRSYADGSSVVTHSWAEFRDLSEEP